MENNEINEVEKQQPETPQPEMPRYSPKKPFYTKGWVMWVTLIFFAPIGIFLMWKYHPEKTKVTKGVLTAAFCLLFIFQIASATTQSEKPQTSSDSTKAEEKESTEKESKSISSISAIYQDVTEEGTEINNDSIIEVTATYDDGSNDTVTGWNISEAATLVAGETTEVTVNYKGCQCPLSVACTTVTEDMYKEQCQDISYGELARNPDSYTGQNVKFTGEIIQVQEDGETVVFRINVSKGDYGIWEDTVMVGYEYDKGASRFLEKDIVTFYGVSAGLYTYTTVLGSDMTIPSVLAEYIELN